jgi:hypothetical protein
MLAMAAGGSLMVLAEDTPAAPTASAATAAAASAPASSATSENSQMQVDNDLRTLDWILSLPPERLTALRKAIENVEKKPQAERDQLKREIMVRIQSLGQLRNEMAAETKTLSFGDQSVLRKYFLTLYTDQIQALQDRFHKAETPEARKAIVQELLKTATDKGIKPDPAPDRNQAQPGGRGGRNGGPNGTGDNGGRGGPRGNGAARPPMPAPLPSPH